MGQALNLRVQSSLFTPDVGINLVQIHHLHTSTTQRTLNFALLSYRNEEITVDKYLKLKQT